MTSNRNLSIGLVVNAYAGIGGEAALKGSDGAARDHALAYLDVSKKTLRTPQRLAQMLGLIESDDIHWVTGEAGLGAEYLVASGIDNISIVYSPKSADAPTTAIDTRNVCLALLNKDCDLIVFCGGDGTARDVFDVIGHRVPCLGLPSGVKMQSGVFAISPAATASVINHVVDHDLTQIAEQDVRDIDEQALRQGKVRSQYYGSLMVPDEPRYLQNLKIGGVEHEPLVLDDLADYLTEIMFDSEAIFLVGPGSTTAHWMEKLGLPNTLVGFDAIQEGHHLQSDLTGRDIDVLLSGDIEVFIVITPTGNQGILLGRGNQQLTPSVIRRVQKHQWLIISAKSKLKALEGRPLIVDTNDSSLDKQLCGLYPVVTGYNDRVLYPISTSYE
ncbi:Uncharacterised protein [BD1-7 clade bacterium]|uniref:ATP-NAD kinase n=1 Tax=BD1-7 clade bacterium TaxID=2029982 RepID=A0A5S9R007_9GAMM|nr:Uncharacterised protein [BD1-7 clade bacterium]